MQTSQWIAVAGMMMIVACGEDTTRASSEWQSPAAAPTRNEPIFFPEEERRIDSAFHPTERPLLFPDAVVGTLPEGASKAEEEPDDEDTDDDGVTDEEDNCPDTPNPLQGICIETAGHGAVILVAHAPSDMGIDASQISWIVDDLSPPCDQCNEGRTTGRIVHDGRPGRFILIHPLVFYRGMDDCEHRVESGNPLTVSIRHDTFPDGLLIMRVDILWFRERIPTPHFTMAYSFSRSSELKRIGRIWWIPEGVSPIFDPDR